MADGDSSTPVEYRDVVGFPGYRVGTDGSVWSRWKRGKKTITDVWTELKLTSDGYGYLRVGLYRERRCTMRRVNVLVLEAFVGPRPPGMQACHFPDRNPANNGADNLRWATPKRNAADRREQGTDCRGEKHPGAKLTMERVRSIRQRIAAGESQRTIATEEGVCQQTISHINTGKTWPDIAIPARVA